MEARFPRHRLLPFAPRGSPARGECQLSTATVTLGLREGYGAELDHPDDLAHGANHALTSGPIRSTIPITSLPADTLDPRASGRSVRSASLSGSVIQRPSSPNYSLQLTPDVVLWNSSHLQVPSDEHPDPRLLSALSSPAFLLVDAPHYLTPSTPA